MTAPRLLVTGFDDFGDVSPNASAEVVRLLPGLFADGQFDLHTEILPTQYASATKRIAALLRNARPDMALCLGVAPTPCVRLEQIAINWIDAPGRPDNAGRVANGVEIVRGGPAAYWSAFRGDRNLLDRLHAANLPAVLSVSAGTFVCNAVMYAAAHHLARADRRIPFGFLHIPRATADIARRPEREQREIAGWPPELSARAVRVIADHWRNWRKRTRRAGA
ncbi:MAG: pyroglutamyl-peptidase I [Deltaproteobacteria bacterium]|nr:pyroglutamyl-peptidase I [Deltaproteobacteria bacterium]